MPWKPGDAAQHTKAADTPAKRARWAKLANACLEHHGDEGRAIKIANAAMDTDAKRAANAKLRKISFKGEMRARMKQASAGEFDPDVDKAE